MGRKKISHESKTDPKLILDETILNLSKNLDPGTFQQTKKVFGLRESISLIYLLSCRLNSTKLELCWLTT